MTTFLLQDLVDKQDGFEIVRDQIGAILVLETANQIALATAASKDPTPWSLRVFSERSNPFGEFVEFDSSSPSKPAPIINISYNGSTYDKRASNVVEQQRAESTFWIDCYAAAASEGNGQGHIPADQLAAYDVHRAVRLVRNYLMAGPNTYLQLQGTVGGRWLQGIEIMELPAEARQVQRVAAARLTLLVSHQEFSPQYRGEPLETLSVNVRRAPNGELFNTVTFSGETTP